MKLNKYIIVSLLLFSFMLSIAHDYIFINSYSSNSSSKIFKQSAKIYSSQEIQKLQLHNSFHLLLEISFSAKQTIAIEKQPEKPLHNKKYLISRIHPVLLRPPLV